MGTMTTVLKHNNDTSCVSSRYTPKRVLLVNYYSSLTVSSRCSRGGKFADFYYDASNATSFPRDIGTRNSISECPCTCPTTGILLDFDFVSAIDGMDGAADTRASRKRTPESIFMAIDLLKYSGDPKYSEDSEIPSCLYRHDAESFFYVLVWICYNYDKGDQVDNVLLKWDADSYLEIARRKKEFLESDRLQLTPGYMPLRKPWFLYLQFYIDVGHFQLESWKIHVRYAKKFVEAYSEDDNFMDVNKRQELYKEALEKMEEFKDTSVLIDLFGFVTFGLFRYILEEFDCN